MAEAILFVINNLIVRSIQPKLEEKEDGAKPSSYNALGLENGQSHFLSNSRFEEETSESRS